MKITPEMICSEITEEGLHQTLALMLAYTTYESPEEHRTKISAALIKWAWIVKCGPTLNEEKLDDNNGAQLLDEILIAPVSKIIDEVGLKIKEKYNA